MIIMMTLVERNGNKLFNTHRYLVSDLNFCEKYKMYMYIVKLKQNNMGLLEVQTN